MKTKILAGILAVLMVLTLFTGCIGETPNDNATPTQNNNETQGKVNETDEATETQQNNNSDKVYTKEELLSMNETPATAFNQEDVDGGVAVSQGEYFEGDVLIIPKQIDGKDVVEISNLAYSYNRNIKAVLIPKSVKTIGKEAFLGCNNLQYFYVDGTELLEIGSRCFSVAERLKEVQIPNTVIKIGEGAFLGMDKNVAKLVVLGKSKYLKEHFDSIISDITVVFD